MALGVKSSKASFARRINREPSPWLALGLPWLSIILASIFVTVIVIASAPVMPPLGFLVFIAWHQLRPGIIPVWAGLPLGFIDDLFSGQPMGSAVLLWSLAAIALNIVEARLPWRNYLTEWLAAAAFIAAYILTGLMIANFTAASTSVLFVLPQIALAVLIYPLLGRVAAFLDRLRLFPIREISR